jgi:hypothetical protein
MSAFNSFRTFSNGIWTHSLPPFVVVTTDLLNGLSVAERFDALPPVSGALTIALLFFNLEDSTDPVLDRNGMHLPGLR